MEIAAIPATPNPALSAMFAAVFAASEGPAEGAAIGQLVDGLLATTPKDEIDVFCAHDDTGTLIGGVLFTRLHYPQDPRHVVLLSPMAVVPDRQGTGVGRALIRHALDQLARSGAEIAITYGDPAFYGKTGFEPITTDQAQPPHALSMPHGWIGRSLTSAPFTALTGPSRCAPALDDPAFW